MMIQQERQLLPPIKDDKLLANISKPYHHFFNACHNYKAPHYGHGRGLKMCTYCNNIGNTIELCFKKHKLPPYLKKSRINNDYSFSDGPTNKIEVELDE